MLSRTLAYLTASAAMAALIPVMVSGDVSFEVVENLDELRSAGAVFMDPLSLPGGVSVLDARLSVSGRRVFKIGDGDWSNVAIKTYFGNQYLTVRSQHLGLSGGAETRFDVRQVRQGVFSVRQVGGKLVCYDHNRRGWVVNRDAVGAWEEFKFIRATVDRPRNNDVVRIESRFGDFLKHSNMESDFYVVREHENGLLSFASPRREHTHRLHKRGTPFTVMPRKQSENIDPRNPVHPNRRYMAMRNADCLQMSWSFWRPHVSSLPCRLDEPTWDMEAWEKFQLQHEGEGYFSIRNNDNKALFQGTPSGFNAQFISHLCCGVNDWETLTIHTVGHLVETQ